MIRVGYRTERSPSIPVPNQKCSKCQAQKLSVTTAFISFTALRVPVITLPRKQILLCEKCGAEEKLKSFLKSNPRAVCDIPPPARYSIFHFGWIFSFILLASAFLIVLAVDGVFFGNQLKMATNPQIGDVIVRELKTPFVTKDGTFRFQLQRVEAVSDKEVTVRPLNLGAGSQAEGVTLYEQHRNDPNLSLESSENLNRERYADMYRIRKIHIIRSPESNP